MNIKQMKETRRIYIKLKRLEQWPGVYLVTNFSTSPTPEEDRLPNFLLVLTQKGTVHVFVCLMFFPVSVGGLYINTTHPLDWFQ